MTYLNNFTRSITQKHQKSKINFILLIILIFFQWNIVVNASIEKRDKSSEILNLRNQNSVNENAISQSKTNQKIINQNNIYQLQKNPRVRIAQQVTQPQELRLLSDDIYTGIQNIPFVAKRLKYIAPIYFPNIKQYFTSLYVRDILDYKGPIPTNSSQAKLNLQTQKDRNIFNEKVKQWGFDFNLSMQIDQDHLYIVLRIASGVQFTNFKVGYLISKDPNFVVGHTDIIRQRCNQVCPPVRTWPVSFIIRSPATGTVFIPFIVGLKAAAPLPSISFTDVSDEPLNSTHRILHLEMLLESIHPIEQIIFSYVSHSTVQAKYALLIFNGFDPNRINDDTFYGVVEVNGYEQIKQIESYPDFFEVIGVALRKAFFLQEDKTNKTNKTKQVKNLA